MPLLAGRKGSRRRCGVWWEEYHVIVVAKGQELKAPELDHRAKRQRVFRISCPEL
jgi:hypothetical protein